MKRFTYTLLIIFAATCFVTAQTQNLFEAPDNLLGGLNEETRGVVGAIGGTVDVSTLGAATYTIPIQVPEGIHGIQPNLSIVYNSQSGNGLLGWGWNLGGMSAITRINQTLYHDDNIKGVDFNDDRFALDGQRLIEIAGTYGANGTEYRTEVDGMTKIVSYSEGNLSPSYFKVWLADGTIAYYGNSNDSKVMLRETDNVCIWLLNRVEDRDGNYMTYHYNSGGAHCFLDCIKYTGNSNANIGPEYIVKFYYHKDSSGNYHRYNVVEKTFIGISDLNQNTLLDSININKNISSNVTKTLFTYSFVYHTEQPHSHLCLYEQLRAINYTCFDITHQRKISYNPTNIEWGEIPSYNNANTTGTECNTPRARFLTSSNHPEYIRNTQKFSGDFNGDGLTDVLALYSPSDGAAFYYGLFYKNNGTYINADGYEEIEFQYVEAMEDILILPKPPYLVWIYCQDITNDGLDDLIILSEGGTWSTGYETIVGAYKSEITQNGGFQFTPITFHDSDGYYSSYQVSHGSRQKANLLIGDFLGNGSIDFIYQAKNKKHNGWGDYVPFVYFSYKYNSPFSEYIECIESGEAMPGTIFSSGDFDGDGITEIWFASEDEQDISGCIIKITSDQNGQLSYTTIKQNFLDAYSMIFPADFNGDGHTDILLYHKNDDSWKVNICGNPNSYGYFYYDITSLIRNAFGDPPSNSYDPGDYSFDLKVRQSINYYITVSDFNGDGKSDVLIRNNDRVTYFYGPITNTGNFSYIWSINADKAGLGAAINYCLISGNFLGQENTSILNDEILHAMPPLSTYYGVTSITDGMGNRTEFEFGYLTENPHEGADNIYTLTRDGEDRTRDIFAVALPIKAVKRITSSNIADPYNVKSISEYTYSGILAHRKGKGILGLTKSTTESYIEGAPFHNYVERLFSSTAMGEHCALTPTEERTFLKKEANGHLKLITETTFSYDKHVHTMNNKVFMPLLTDQITDHYDIYRQINGTPVFVKREITQNKVTSWRHDCIEETYFNSGTTTNQNIYNYEDCEFLGRWKYTFNDISIEDWLIQRPVNIGEGCGIGFLQETIYQYNTDIGKPNQLKSVYVFPSQHYSSMLATCTTYTYDMVGNIKTETTNGLNDNNLQPRKTEYFYRGYRLLQTKREWLDESQGLFYDTEYEYDPYFSFVNKETNCRGQITLFDRDPLGINCTITSPNGITTRSQTGWLSDNSGYYEWTYTQGSSPVLTTYDLNGRMTKVETYGFDENQLIVQNNTYNNLGQLEIEEDAHLSNASIIAKTIYTYDDYGVLRKTTYPNGNIARIKRDPDNSFIISTELSTSEGIRTTTQETNAIGQVVTSWDEAGNTVSYTYFHNGLLKTATVNNDPSTTIEIMYDEARNRIRLHDPDYCGNGNDLICTYDAYGQLRTTTTPNGDVTVYEYDAFGRTITRTEGNEVTAWTYNNLDSRFKGLLKRVSHNGTQERTVYTYDPNTRRLINTTETINGNMFNPTCYSYNDFGKVESIQYPTNITIGRSYTSTGHLLQITDANGSNLWTTVAKNGQGQITEFVTGDGEHRLKGVYQYHPDIHFLKDQLVTNQNNQKIHHFHYNYKKFGNLADRSTVLHGGIKESFHYDELNRLDQSIVTYQDNDYISDIAYDDNGLGCIVSKTAAFVGAPAFSNAQYGIDGRPHAVRTADMDINVFPTSKLQTEYNSFDKLSQLTQYNDDGSIDRCLSYMYGSDHQRIYMTESDGYGVVRTKTYLGNCEFIYDEGETRALTYLTGPLGVFGVYEQAIENGQVASTTMHYIFTDHLGSITTITNDKGVVEQELSYDAWGNLRDPETWSNTFEGTPMLDRGFTGHEHLYAFGLINMNGRMYDPVMGSFLSPDNYVASPDFSQAFNRYSYCLNNPLKYTDPDGEFPWIPMVIGAGIGVVTNGVDNMINDRPFFQGAGKAALIGGVQGLVSFGIGQVASGIASVGGRIAFQTFAHGTLGGVSTTLNGGNFANGFISGAASSLVATGMGSLTQNMSSFGKAIGTIGGGALAGGISSSISGGNFWDGFRNGAISSGLNHGVHMGVFGKGLMIASITGRTRHLFGPDAIAAAVTVDASAGVAMSVEGGGITILIGKDKGFHTYTDLGMGAGGLTSAVGMELVKLYSSSSNTEVGIEDFSGSRWEMNLSLPVLFGATAVYSERYNNSGVKSGFTFGYGISLCLDFMPDVLPVNFNVNYGATNVGDIHGLNNELRKSFKIRQ